MTFHSTSERLQSVVSDMGTESCPDGIDLAALPRGNDYFGHKTLHYVEQVDPNSIDDRWIVPDLECFAVTATVTFKGARNVSQANSFQEGEPPGDLKAPPSDYVERSPRAVEALHIKQSKGRSFVGDTIAKRWEAAYLRRR
jgi:hypothetical protein